jgi:hypothetical protein
VNKSPAFFFFLQSTGRIPLSPIRAAWSEKIKMKKEERSIQEHPCRPAQAHRNFVYSALASFRMGCRVGSAHYQWAKKSH